MKSPSKSAILLASIASLLATPFAFAGNLYWDTNLDTVGSGNTSGAWDSTTSNWSTDSTGATITSAWTAGNTAVFAAGTDFTGTNTVTLSDTQSLGGITVNSQVTNLSITGGTLDFGFAQGVIDTSAWGASSGKTFKLDSLITGIGGLFINSNGNMSASGGNNTSVTRLGNLANTYTGDVTIQSGLVAYAADGSFGDAANKIILNGGGLLDTGGNVALSRAIQVNAGGGTIRTYGQTAVTWSSTITGSGNINRTDAGTITFTGNLSGYAGTFDNQGGTTVLDGTVAAGGNWKVSNGTLRIGANGLAAGGTLTLNGGTLSSNAAAGAGDRIFSNAVNVTANVTLGDVTNSGVLTFANTVDLGAASRTLTTNSAVLMSGAVTNGTLVKSGAGTLTLSGNNTYTGATTVNAGTLTLDYSTNNTSKLSDSAALTLGGSTVNLVGGTHTELVGSTALTAGTASTINGATGSAKISLGAITRGVGASLNLQTAGIASTTNAVGASGAFGSWLTIGGNSLATKSGNDIVGVAYTDTAIGGSIANSSSTHARITGTAGAVTLAAPTTNVATLTQTATGATTLDIAGNTLRLSAQGSILSATGAGALTIGTGATPDVLTAGGTNNTAGVLDFNTRGAAVTVNAAVTDNGTGAVSLMKIGSDILTLSGTAANTYTGLTTVAGGTLTLSKTSGLNAIAGNVSLTGGTLTWGAANQIADTADIDISGSGGISSGVTESVHNLSVTVNSATVGSAKFNLGSGSNFSANSLALTSDITGGFAATNNFSFGTSSANTTLSIGSGGWSMNNFTYLLSQSGQGNTATVNLAGNFTGAGTNNIAASNANANIDLQGATRTFAIASGVTTIAAKLGDGGLIKTGNGVLTLTGANTYTGTTTVAGGILRLNGGSITSGTGINLIGDGTVLTGIVDGFDYSTYPFKGVTRGGTLYINGTGDNIGAQTVTMSNGTILWYAPGGSTSTTVQNIDLASGHNTIAVAPRGGNNTLNISNLTRSGANSTVEFRSAYSSMGTGEPRVALTSVTGAAIANTNGILGGWATVSQDGGENAKSVTGFANWNGSTIVQAGFDGQTSAAALSTATATQNWLVNGNSANWTISSDLTVNSLVVESDLKINGNATLTIASGGLILRTNDFWIQSDDDTGSLTSGEATGKLFAYSDGGGYGDQAIRVVIKDNGSTPVTFIKGGAGIMVLDHTNTYTGGTVINQGILELQYGGGSSGTIRGSVTVNAGGTLLLTTGDATGYGGGSDALTSINLRGGTLNVGTTENQTLGNATINMTGAQITGIAGSNLDFFGGASGLSSLASAITSVINGVAISPLRQGNTTFTVAKGTTPSGIDLDIQSVIRTSPSADADNAVLTITGGGTVALSGNNTISGSATRYLNVTGGSTLMVGNGGTSGTLGSMDVVNDATLAFNRSDAAGSFSNVISGAGQVKQIGTGTTTLLGANTYTGGTTVSAGTLSFAGGALGTTGNISMNGGALQWNGTNTEDVSSRIVMNAGKAATFDTNSNDVTFAAGIGGSTTGSLVKAGIGKLTLGGANSYNGNTTVNAGILNVMGSLSGSAVTVNSGATFAGSGSVTTNNQAFIVASGAKLDPTSAAFTANTGTANFDISGAVTSASSGALVFNLDSIANSDKITLTLSGGALAIGSGVLDFSDFAFTTSGGFGAGTYTLIDSNALINGTLGTNLTGTIAGMDATLSLGDNGNDVILTVVPEPGSATALFGGMGVLVGMRRRSRKV